MDASIRHLLCFLVYSFLVCIILWFRRLWRLCEKKKKIVRARAGMGSGMGYRRLYVVVYLCIGARSSTLEGFYWFWLAESP